MRWHEGARNRAYVGTFVVSSSQGMSSSRIWHICRGEQQVERVESLTGPARSVFRHNDEVLTFVPSHGMVRVERRESLGLFSALLQSADSSLADFYTVKPLGRERMAGIQAEVLRLVPKDRLRFGYQVWAEQKSGLVLKLQTWSPEGELLEQAAFSELQLDAPVSMDKLLRMMRQTEGYRVDKPALSKTSLQAHGWDWARPVPGFKPVSCQQRAAAPDPALPLHCVFSDGLASVSVFVGAAGSVRSADDLGRSWGATHSLSVRAGQQAVTVVGEVPAPTLRLFAAALERRK